MADWGNVQRGIESGYVMGRQTGGRLSGIGKIIGQVADKFRKEREMDAETGQKINLLGIEGLMTGKITPAAQGEAGTTFDLPMGKFKPVTSITDQLNKLKLERESPSGYQEDLNAATEAINKGKDPNAVFQRISSKYPYKSSELKRVLLVNEKETIADIIRAARGE